MGILSRTGVRNDVRNSEFYEKPHVMRNRQKSERHRRRFQEMVRFEEWFAGRSLSSELWVYNSGLRSQATGLGLRVRDGADYQIRSKVQMVQAVRNRR